MSRKNKVIEVEELYLLDRAGCKRALLSTDESDGGASIAFYDDHECERLRIGVTQDKLPAITIMRDDGRAAIALGEDADGRIALTMFNKSGDMSIVLVVHPDGDHGIQLLDAKCNAVWKAP